METEQRIKPLHNFTLPDDLRWANTRHLRCMKLHRSTSPNDISTVRRKAISDLNTAAVAQNVKDSNSNKPWNLRTRRSGFKKTANNADEYFKLDCSGNEVMDDDKSVEKRDKFSVSLSKKEMEEDFAVFGQRLHRRPKKRPRLVQKQLDTLFPGVWLKEVTADMYKVDEAAP